MSRQYRDSVQKKPEKEKSKSKEIAELKRENHSLKRQLSRLRKQVTHLLDIQGQADYEESPDSMAKESTTGPSEGCVSCGSKELTRIDLPMGVLIVCKSCKHRRKL